MKHWTHCCNIFSDENTTYNKILVVIRISNRIHSRQAAMWTFILHLILIVSDSSACSCLPQSVINDISCHVLFFFNVCCTHFLWCWYVENETGILSYRERIGTVLEIKHYTTDWTHSKKLSITYNVSQISDRMLMIVTTTHRDFATFQVASFDIFFPVTLSQMWK